MVGNVRSERGSEDLEWEEPAGRPDRPRRKAGGGGAARIIVERLAWTARPWVFWPNANVILTHPAAPWSDKLELAEQVLIRRIGRHPAGAYAVSMTAQPIDPSNQGGTEPSFSDSVARLTPQVTEIFALGDGIVIGSQKLAEARRFRKAIPKLVGDVEQWRQKQESALRDAREILDAAERADRRRVRSIRRRCCLKHHACGSGPAISGHRSCLEPRN